MTEQPQTKRQRKASNTSNISSRPVTMNEDGDTITIGDVGAGAAVAAGRGASANVQAGTQLSDLAEILTQWQQEMESKIDAQSDLTAEDKQDLKEQVVKIKTEAAKGDKANPGRLERLINTLGVMGPDILEVAIATLKNPFSGIGLVLQKIDDRVKLEREAKAE